MALPHYKLQTPEASAAFPVLLAPAEASPRFGALTQILRSRKLLLSLQILAIVAGAALLWLLLDPTIKSPKPIHLWIPALTLGVCFLFMILIALVKNRAEAISSDEPEILFTMAELPVSKAKTLAPAQEFAIEMNLEQWSSEPFEEIMDEGVMAEVFNDDLVAPDHMVFSLKVAEYSRREKEFHPAEHEEKGRF